MLAVASVLALAALEGYDDEWPKAGVDDLHISPIAGSPFGYLVEGLSRAHLHPPSAAVARKLRRAFGHSRGLLLFRGLDTPSWTSSDMVMLSAIFGSVESAPADGPYESLLGGDERVHVFSKVPSSRVFGRGGAARADPDRYDAATGTPSWHTDQSFRDPPPRASSMLCHATPADGSGATLFASTLLAHAALNATQQERLDGLVGVHSYAQLHACFQRFIAPPSPPPGETCAPGGEPPPPRFLSEAREAALREPARHPIARKHKGTGKKALYIAPHVVARVEAADGTPLAGEPAEVPSGAEPDRAAPLTSPLVDELAVHATAPAFRYRHRWRVGDLVVWDNTATMHAATHVPAERERERVMWRTTILQSSEDIAHKEGWVDASGRRHQPAPIEEEVRRWVPLESQGSYWFPRRK